MNEQTFALESMNHVYPARWVCTGDTLQHDTTDRDGALCLIGGYWITCHEITQNLWYWYMRTEPSATRGEQLPVTNVTRHEVDSLCYVIYLSSGKPWRLPTREEWLLAFRGGLFSEGYRYAGSDHADNVAWHRGNSQGQPHLIGLRIANELGLHDMSGNVAEMALAGDSVVVLGGSYLDPPLPDGSLEQGNTVPDATGFRLVCTAPLWFDTDGNRIFR
ncbi:MAG: SUMF1/EgtB/PvdO family nonheme iron enzyme [Bacteroidales bacterium]|nr:SUMF1/EgtB/PvdO family nonheme iron enzyme [Bacteroidales bacterium]